MELTASDIITIKVKDRDGEVRTIEIPEGINLNLMEVLKAYEFGMRATCGGMGLCADCHCKVLEGGDNLPYANDQELETLDNQPDSTDASRLACQLKSDFPLNGLFIELLGPEE